DVFYRSSSAKRKAWIDFIGVLLFLLPVSGFLLIKSWDFAAVSWSIKEASRESGGLPYPLIPLAKSILVAMPFTVGLQGISILLKSLTTIRGRL
ncbi:MAG: TRAP transporter small permease subunit, partial [Woeseiaceae bacterium]